MQEIKKNLPYRNLYQPCCPPGPETRLSPSSSLQSPYALLCQDSTINPLSDSDRWAGNIQKVILSNQLNIKCTQYNRTTGQRLFMCHVRVTFQQQVILLEALPEMPSRLQRIRIIHSPTTFQHACQRTLRKSDFVREIKTELSKSCKQQQHCSPNSYFFL